MGLPAVSPGIYIIQSASPDCLAYASVAYACSFAEIGLWYDCASADFKMEVLSL